MKKEAKTVTHVRNIILCAIFAALIAVGAFIRIPVPPIPFTLQIFFVAMAGMILGPKWGTLSVLVYVILGIIGVPVFTKPAGPAYVFEPTFGYLLGFILQAFVTSIIIKKRNNHSTGTLLIACFSGALCSFLIGVPYFYMIMNLYMHNHTAIASIVYSGFLLFVPADTVLMILAALLGRKILPILIRSHLISVS